MIINTVLKKIVLGSLLGLFLLTLSPALSFIMAQDSAEETQSTTDSLRERIQNIVEQQKEKVQSVLGELSNQRRGFVGQVVRVSEETLGLDVRGATRIVPLDENVILMRNGAEINTESVEVGSWAEVLGIVNNDSFIAKKITFFTTSLLPKPHFVSLGSLKTIKTNSLDFQPRGQETILTVSLNRTTVFQNSEGEETRNTEFVEDDQVLLIGYQENDDTIITVMRALAPFTPVEEE